MAISLSNSDRDNKICFIWNANNSQNVLPELSKHNRIHHQSTFFEWWGHENPTQNSLRKQPTICNINLPLVSPPNDVWEMSKEISYWWRITTQIWVVLLIGWINHVAWPIRSTTQIWVVMCHLYGISVLISQTSFGGETSGSVTKCRLFSQAKTQTEF